MLCLVNIEHLTAQCWPNLLLGRIIRLNMVRYYVIYFFPLLLQPFRWNSLDTFLKQFFVSCVVHMSIWVQSLLDFHWNENLVFLILQRPLLWPEFSLCGKDNVNIWGRKNQTGLKQQLSYKNSVISWKIYRQSSVK